MNSPAQSPLESQSPDIAKPEVDKGGDRIEGALRQAAPRPQAHTRVEQLNDSYPSFMPYRPSFAQDDLGPGSRPLLITDAGRHKRAFQNESKDPGNGLEMDKRSPHEAGSGRTPAGADRRHVGGAAINDHGEGNTATERRRR